MAYSARPTSTDGLTKLIYQPGHGFVVGEIIYYKAGIVNAYVPAFADAPAHCGSPLMVSIIIDVNNFYATQEGWVTGITSNYGSPFSTGVQYYLNDVSGGLPNGPGTLTTTAPTANGHVISALFWADTTSSGYFTSTSGMVIESGQLFNWAIVGVDTPMLVNNGYMTSSLTTLNMTLPALSAVGDIIRITNLGGNFTVVQIAGQQITFGDDNTTLGAGGSITTASVGDTVELVCYNANTGWQVLSSMGNFTIV